MGDEAIGANTVNLDSEQPPQNVRLTDLALRIWSKAQLLLGFLNQHMQCCYEKTELTWEFPRDENRRGRELVITHLRQAERRELSAYERKVGGDVNCDSHASKVSVDSLVDRVDT
jgi:hypothetical protein